MGCIAKKCVFVYIAGTGPNLSRKSEEKNEKGVYFLHDTYLSWGPSQYKDVVLPV